MPEEMYGQNMLENPSAETGDLSYWEQIQFVSVVPGGVSGAYTFRFEPTASMEQTISVPGQPPDLKVGGFFLPGRDIKSSAVVRSEIVLTLHYGDGSTGEFIVPAKSFIEGKMFSV